jgi:gliding motility-associated-like protein
MKKYLLFFMVLIFSSKLFAQPVISSFTPTVGPIGTVVNITGTNFSTTLTNNIVFFGAVKATVSAATATSLTVTVPIGTTYDPITVTTLNNNLTAYSRQPFHVIFSGAGPVFNAASFSAFVNFTVGLHPHDISNTDLDLDGKPDFITPNVDGATFSLLKNICTIGNLSYTANVETTTLGRPDGVVSGDFDGDGDQDIAMNSWDASSVSVLKNISTIGTILFAPKVDFTTGTNPEGIAAGDIDGDGKPDIVTTDVNAFTVSVLKNTGSLTTIVFASPVSFPTGFAPRAVVIRDLDGDGKPDLAVATETPNKVVVFRNTSTPGIISFAPRVDLLSGTRPWGIAVGDLDGDGKPDIVNTNNGSLNASVFKNTSTPGTISFDPKIDLFVGDFPQKMTIGDLDGDGKLDLAITNSTGFFPTVSLYKNTSIIGTIQFIPKVDYAIGSGSTSVTIGDFDGDGLPDIGAAAKNVNAASILRNTIVCAAATINSQPTDSIICAGTNASFSINATNAVSYQWQVDVGAGWANISNNATYSGATSNSLIITAATIAMNNYKYRCVVTNSCGFVNSASALLIVNTPSVPSINISATAVTICQGTFVTFTAVPVNGGSTPAFQWKKNNINVGANSNTYTDNSLINGDVINCVLTSNGNCITTPNATSNNVTITVSLPVTPAVSISGSANNICFGTPVTFTAIETNGGVAAAYQWKKNGINVGTNNVGYTDNALNNGDIITCVLASSLGCLTSPTATSNQVVMIIIPAVTPTITVTPSANNICPGTLVTFNTTITNGGLLPTFQWKKNGINVGANSPAYSDNVIANGDIIACVLTSNLVASCLTNPVANSNNISMALQNLPGNVNLGADKNGCAGSPVILNAQPGFVSYLWQDASTNATFNATASGTYQLQATDACGNISTDDIVVSFKPTPVGFLPPDTAVCSYEPIIINPATIYNQYLWNTNASSPSITISTPGLYWLQVTDNNNCIGRDTINVLPKNCLRGLYIPNAFTPNGDTKNDEFKPQIFGTLKQYEFKVLNRYGEMVFYSRDLNKGWDGKLKVKDQNLNVFVWICTYQLEGQMVSVEKGTVLLVR